MRKRWTERSRQRLMEDELESPRAMSLQEISDADSEIGSLPSLGLDLDAADSLASFERVDGALELGASAKSKPGKRQRYDVIDVADEISSGSAATCKVPVFDVRTLNHAKLHTADLAQFKFPWERGLLKNIFTKTDDVPGVEHQLSLSSSSNFRVRMNVDENTKVSAEVADAPLQEVKKCIYPGVVRTAEDIGYREARDAKRALAVSNWWKLLATNVSASEIGLKVEREAHEGMWQEYGKELVDACFGVKSPNTLLKRYYSVNSFMEWCALDYDSDWLPLDERLVWLYVRHLKISQAAPTKPASFLEAIRFCWFVLGTHGGQEVLDSFRVRGLSAQMFSQKKEWQPADILTVCEVKKIHHFMENEANHLTDRVIAGHLLHLLYTRARWSDLLAVKHAFIDSEKVYFEMVTRAHKGAKGADAKAKLLPLVAPCMGVTGDWACKYVQLREQAELPLPGETEASMLPAPSAISASGWSSRPMSSEEGSEFLRALLMVEKSPERRISSHSLKSTSMSWTSKYGINFEARALLARHISSVSNPTAVYSRDLLSPVLRAFCEVVNKIGGFAFEPDKTRSGMITPTTNQPAPTTPWMSQIFTVQEDENVFGKTDAMQWSMVSQSDVGLQAAEVLDENEDAFKSDAREVLQASEAAGLQIEDMIGGDNRELSSTSESKVETSSSSSEDRRIVRAHPIFEGVPIESGQHYVNNKSAVLHCVTGKDKFRCGRKVTSSYTLVKELNGIRCSRCYDV